MSIVKASGNAVKLQKYQSVARISFEGKNLKCFNPKVLTIQK
jgi:hypothetical protein